MSTIHIWVKGEKYELQEETPVLAAELLRKSHVEYSFPCGGCGSCGKCRILVEGAANEPTAQEQALLTEQELHSGVRLACCCQLIGDAKLEVSPEGGAEILQWSQGLVPIGMESEPLEGEGSERGRRRLGIACDVGTTTVAMVLWDLQSSRVISQAAELNCQRPYGADVISRVSACDERGTELLSGLIRNQLTRMASKCLKDGGAAPEALEKAVVTGNTVMLHILEGLDAHSLTVSPFQMQSAFGAESAWKLLGAPVFLPACIGAFIGADVLCAMLAAQMDSGIEESGHCALLADIGTNGEMALAMAEGNIMCCSAPAGPAFEGAGISMGMSASEGAIQAVRLGADGSVEYDVIGNEPAKGHGRGPERGPHGPVKAKGICGSGLLDCVALMGRLRVMDETGFLEEEFPIGESGVRITQLDIRQVQLAKSAVCAGIRTLFQKAGISPDQVTHFNIAGGFGSYMNLDSAAEVGLIPRELLPAARFMGNGALAGASALLLDPAAKQRAQALAERSTELHLAADSYFIETYLEEMSF